MWNQDAYKISWQESFELLKPNKFGLLALVSLRSLIGMYGSLLYAWFLPITLLVGLVVGIPSLVCAFYITLLVRATRPSIENKWISYWQQPIFVDWIVFFLVFILSHIPLLIDPSHTFWRGFLEGLSGFLLYGFSVVPGSESLGVLALYLAPFTILFVLFLLDAPQGVWPIFQSFGRAVAMFFANFPFLFVVYLVLRLFLSLCFVVSSVFIQNNNLVIIGWILLFAVVIPMYVCFLTSFYSKRVHEQFNLYFKG